MADDNDAAERRRRRSTGMGGISTLPEHLQHEVFSRVGNVKALFKFAATCRGWLHRFSDRAFLREICPSQGQGSGHRACFLGVFVQDKWFNPYNKAMARMTMGASSTAALAPVFFPALGSPLGPVGRALNSFVRGDDDDGTFDYAKLLAARRGIVLLWLAPRTPEEMDGCHLFGVCNPVTSDRHVLQPLEYSRTLVGRCTVTGYAIIAAADDDSCGNGTPSPAARWTFSQLLVITHLDKVNAAYVQSYSAATRRWSLPTRCLDRCVSLVSDKSAVVHSGAAHWLCMARGDGGDDQQLYRLSVEVATARISLTRLPVRVGGEQLLCVNSDGKLAVASVYPMHVTVWTAPDGAGDDTPAAAWLRTSFRVAPRQHHEKRWCSFNQGSLLALFWGDDGSDSGSGSGGVFFILDLDTKVMEEVLSLDLDNKATGFLARSNNVRYLTCVPYDMDFVEFFMLQLGGIRERFTGTTTTSETEYP